MSLAEMGEKRGDEMPEKLIWAYLVDLLRVSKERASCVQDLYRI